VQTRNIQISVRKFAADKCRPVYFFWSLCR